MAVIAPAMAPDGKSLVAVYRDANDPFGHTPILLWGTESGEVLKKNDSPELKANGGGFLSHRRVVYFTLNGKEFPVWSLRGRGFLRQLPPRHWLLPEHFTPF